MTPSRRVAKYKKYKKYKNPETLAESRGADKDRADVEYLRW